jgi:glutamate-1-semialdehyde aminotransferase
MSANRFLDPSSASARLFEQAQRLIPGGSSKANSQVKPHPFYVASGRGCRITDLDGVERLDAINNLFRVVTTSKPPRTYRDTVEAAASERMGRLLMYLLDTGVLVNTNGLACLSTPMGEAELQEIVQAFDRALWQLRRAR